MSERGEEFTTGTVTIDLERLRADIDAVNAIGRREGESGVNRISFSDADMAGRRWLFERFEAAGLTARVDAVGNVFGRWAQGSGAAVLAGSHLDTVPQGGPLDGTLGVCAALEAVRAIRETGLTPKRPIEIVCTADEEGRFGGMLGSQAICGEIGPEWIARAVDEAGVRLADAMRAQGLDPYGAAARNLGDIAVFLELHVEQGPVLEQAGIPIGIVDAISGVFNWTVTLTGKANHSGTTPMEIRRDAFRGLADFGAAIPGIIATAGGPATRLTVGRVTLRPNFPHSIPGEAVFSIVGRDAEGETMKSLATACRTKIVSAAESHGLSASISEQSWLAPTKLDPSVKARLAAIAKAGGLTSQIMTSGAGHDAQIFARYVPAGLIFVPSVAGVSHAPDEQTEWADIAQGATLLARAMAYFSMC